MPKGSVPVETDIEPFYYIVFPAVPNLRRAASQLRNRNAVFALAVGTEPEA